MRKYVDKIDSITGKVEELGSREGSVMKEVTGLKEVLEQKTMVNERVGGEKMKGERNCMISEEYKDITK